MNSSQELLSRTNSLIPISYRLVVEIDPMRTNFRAFLRIGTKFNSNNADGPNSKSFKLHCKDIIILSAKIKKGYESFQDLRVNYDRKEETVNFCSQNDLKDFDIIELCYIGRVNYIKTSHDVTTGLFQTNFMDQKSGISDSYLISTHCQPTYARAILPCLDEPEIKTSFQLEIKSWKRFKFVSNMAAISYESLKMDDSIIDWQAVKFGKTPPMASSLFGFTIGDLDFIHNEVVSIGGRIPVRIFSPWEISRAAFALDTVQKYLPILEHFFGRSYPLDKLDFVLLPFLSDKAMENFGMISIQTNYVLVPPSLFAHLDTRQQLMQLLVHELVHQWIGNYISFDSWSHLWFNESFATFTACHLLESNGDLPGYWCSDGYLRQQVHGAILRDLQISTPSILEASERISNSKDTGNLFDHHSYTKGIVILRSIQLGIGDSEFESLVKNLFKNDNLLKRAVKPIEIFRQLEYPRWIDFFDSWYKTPGVPLLKVTITDNTERTQLFQERLIEDSNSDDDDTIYEIPLFIKLLKGGLDKKHVIMKEKSLKLEYPIILCNHNSQGYYLVSYESMECYDQLAEELELGNLSETDLVKIFDDLSYFIGSLKYQFYIHLQGFYQLLSRLSGDKVDLKMFPRYWHGLSRGLEILQTIQLAIKTYGSDDKLSKFQDSIIQPLMSKISWPQESFLEKDYNYYEIITMSQVMFLAQEIPEMVILCHKYFKHLLRGPNKSIPIDIVGSIFAVVSRNSKTIKQYKSLVGLVKSSKGIVNHVFRSTLADTDSEEMSLHLQNYAITNMGFFTNSDLINRLLNFVATNIESTSIELALFGLAYNSKHHPVGVERNVRIRDIVLEWFKRQYDQWAYRSLKPGYASAERMKKSLSNISLVIFRMFADLPEEMDAFALIKQNKFGKELKVYELWQTVRHNELPKVKIYQSILGF